jgi:hypothetical protein
MKNDWVSNFFLKNSLLYGKSWKIRLDEGVVSKYRFHKNI